MTTGADLRDLLQPVVTPADSGFVVIPLTESPRFRIGRGVDGALVLLTPADADPEPPTRLRRLSLDPRLRCSVTIPGRAPEEGEFGVVQFRPDDAELIPHFLDVVAALVNLLGPDPADGEVSQAMRSLVRLFDHQAPMRGSVLGLWGELLAISGSSDPHALVDAWHTHVDARFDFSAPGHRLEVKATTLGERVHRFSLPQLQPVPATMVTILSFMTTETAAGTSVGDLVARLEHRLAGDPPRQMKLHQQVAEVLGSDWWTYLDHRFDEQQASKSWALLPAASVPRVECEDTAIREVRLVVDCSDVRPDSAPSGLAALIGSSSATAGDAPGPG